jgi:hypothetical protein
MRLHDKVAPKRYEQILQEIRYERQAETKRIERLSTILAKKVDSAKMKRLRERWAGAKLA